MNYPFLAGFILFVAVLLALDLGLINRKSHVVSVKEALCWSAVWVALAALFNVGIYFFWDWIAPTSTHSAGEAAMTFLAGYLLEESLSVDNVFVFALIFSYFRVPAMYQHRVLFWGVIGAIVMRGVMIALGAALVARFDWILYFFGAILLFTGFKMAFGKSEAPHPEKNPLVRLVKKFVPVTQDYHGRHFAVRDTVTSRWALTPLFIVLIVVETSDLVFASDSLPAIFAITQDPTLIFTSNVFAILGLRSLYFVLADMMGRFRFLNVGLAVVLTFIGLKIMLHRLVPIPISLSLAFIALALGTAVAVSLLKKPAPEKGA
jgi:tellurite resistance protein TerC